MARVLVTAALGNVGREVARECALLGLTVRVAGRELPALAARFPAMEVAHFDFLDRSTWAAALAECDYVFLLRPPPLGDMDSTLCPLVSEAYTRGVKHIVFLSVAGADRMKWVPHRKVELHLESLGKAWTILRPGFFAQNLQDAYRADILEHQRLYVPAAQGRVAFIDVRDVAAVAAKVLQNPQAYNGQALTLTGPEAVTFDHVAKVLSQTLGRPIHYQAASILGYAWHLRSRRHTPLMQAIIQTVLHVGLRRGDAELVTSDVQRVLGRRPRSVEEYIQEAVQIWRGC